MLHLARPEVGRLIDLALPSASVRSPARLLPLLLDTTIRLAGAFATECTSYATILSDEGFVRMESLPSNLAFRQRIGGVSPPT